MDAKAVMAAVCEVYERWNEGPLNDVQALLQIQDALDQWTEGEASHTAVTQRHAPPTGR